MALDELDIIFSADNFYTVTFSDAEAELNKLIMANYGIIPIKKGDKVPSTDGLKMFLPPFYSDFKDSKSDLTTNRNMSLYFSDAIHEALHITEGTFLVDFSKYLDTFEYKNLAHSIFNILDDARIEYNGKRNNMPYWHKELLENSYDYLTSKKEHLSDNPLEGLIDLYSTKLIVKNLPSHYNDRFLETEELIFNHEINTEHFNSNEIKTNKDLFNKIIKLSESVYGKSVRQSITILPQIYDLITNAHKQIFDDAKEKSEKTSDKIQEIELNLGVKGDTLDFSQSPNVGDSLEDILDALPEEIKDAMENNDSCSNNSVIISSRKDYDDEIKKPDSKDSLTVLAYNPATNSYDEFYDLTFKKYDKSHPNTLNLDIHKEKIQQIIEYFSLLKPNKLQIKYHTQEPDELNMTSCIEAIADPSIMHDAQIYNSYFVNKRDSLTAILIDISGSTDENIEGSSKRIIDIEKETSGILYAALTAIGDEVPVYAFTAKRDTTVYELNGIDDIGRLEPEWGNQDGIAIRGVISKLLEKPQIDKKIIVISDGRPNYNNGIEDTSMAFFEAENRNIKTLYFNIGANTEMGHPYLNFDRDDHDYFSKLTKNVTYGASISNSERLPSLIMDYIMNHNF